MHLLTADDYLKKYPIHKNNKKISLSIDSLGNIRFV